jgi:hypothetical protein
MENPTDKSPLRKRLAKPITQIVAVPALQKKHEPFNIQLFLMSTPLYKRVSVHISPMIIGGGNEKKPWELDDTVTFYDMFKSETKVEGYNPAEKKPTTFKVMAKTNWSPSQFAELGGFITLKLKCTRYDNEIIFLLHWEPKKRTITKVGQSPSLADFHLYELKKYDKIISDSLLKEFAKGIRLAAMGFGIGSFVYLRRIFESLIFETFEQHKDSLNMSTEEFKGKRMENKIELLKDELPELIVKNDIFYGVLSSGIHQLDEDTCNACFNTLRLYTELILDQKLQLINQQKKFRQGELEMQAMNKKLKESGKI